MGGGVADSRHILKEERHLEDFFLWAAVTYVFVNITAPHRPVRNLVRSLVVLVVLAIGFTCTLHILVPDLASESFSP